MLKSVLFTSLRKMSSERKIKETLAKKLSGKKVPRTTIQPKVEQAVSLQNAFKYSNFFIL